MRTATVDKQNKTFGTRFFHEMVDYGRILCLEHAREEEMENGTEMNGMTRDSLKEGPYARQVPIACEICGKRL